MVVKREDLVVEDGGSNPSMALFFLNYFFFISFSFHLIFSSFCINLDLLIRKSSQILLKSNCPSAQSDQSSLSA